jgi:hypothetical protein
MRSSVYEAYTGKSADVQNNEKFKTVHDLFLSSVVHSIVQCIGSITICNLISLPLL